MATDYYEILGVARNATEAEIKKAYRRLARKHHPDVNPGDAAAERRFKEIQEAYAVLSDSDKRAQFDRFGRVDDIPGGRSGPFRHSGVWQEAGPVRFGFAEAGIPDLGEVFSEFFGGRGATARARRRPQRGSDHEISIEIAFEEAMQGTAVTLPVQRKVVCSSCGGSGGEPPGRCPTCHGAGGVIASERLRVKIPEGIDDGKRVRVAGKGAEGGEGGPAGDLMVRVAVRPHPYFKRDGDTIRTTVPVTFAEAYRGAEIEVGTIHGPVRAKIPPGTNSGTTFRLRGKGVRNTRTRAFGDHLYTVEIVVPPVMSPVGHEVARQVAELYTENPRSSLPRGL